MILLVMMKIYEKIEQFVDSESIEQFLKEYKPRNVCI